MDELAAKELYESLDEFGRRDFAIFGIMHFSYMIGEIIEDYFDKSEVFRAADENN